MPITANLEGFKIELQARKALLDCLAQVPFLRVTQPEYTGDTGHPTDVLLQVEWPDGRRPPLCLVADVKSSGEPRYARLAVTQLFYYTERLVPGSYGVFIAPYISPYAAAICEREGYGYLDFAGNCHLVFDQVYVHREGGPNPFTPKRELVSLYKPKAERVLRVLLSHPGRAWRLQELAEEAEVSLGYTHRVKERLLDQEWLGDADGRLRLLQPERMLSVWAENYDFARQQKHQYHSLLPIHEVEAALSKLADQEQLTYAFTGFSGAARVAPHARYQRVHAYITPADRHRYEEALSLKPVSSGANVTLLEPYDQGVFYGAQNRDGACVVSPVQLYLDLRMLPGRGEDAAEFLLDTVLRPQW